MMTNVFFGVALHAIGGLAAATCFVPQKAMSKWSHQTFWLLFCFSAWFVFPVLIAILTIPELGQVIAETPSEDKVNSTIFGAIYGFGGMAFGLSIRYIGFSLTYSIAIGISAVLGTVIPSAVSGNLITDFLKPGGSLVLAGFIISMVGIGLCGYSGMLKENEINKSPVIANSTFDIQKGFILVAIAGVLSAVFNLSLASGASMDRLAEAQGAGVFHSGAKYIFAMGGSFITNLLFWIIVHIKSDTLAEYVNYRSPINGVQELLKYYLLAFFAGALWYGQFLFYGLGHAHMGEYKFISWGIHMSMLIFFSFGTGYLFKEWDGLGSNILGTLYAGLITLIISFTLITYGSSIGA